MQYRRFAYMFSGAFVLATVVWLVVHGGPKYSVDFTGGTLLQIRTSRVVPPIRCAQPSTGGLPGDRAAADDRREPRRVPAADEIRVRAGPVRHGAGRAPAAPPRRDGGPSPHRKGGPKVGGELRQKALWALVGSLGGILLYVGIRYQFKYALGAIVALFHDVFVTLGVLCFTGREVSLTVLAALLTIAGYSINDTIVVFDRIRERSKALRKEKHSRAMDIAVNETLSRTVITAFTVFLTALSLFIWGGEVLRDFSFAMLVGVVFGTYSSVYVASGLALDVWIGLDRRKGIQAE